MKANSLTLMLLLCAVINANATNWLVFNQSNSALPSNSVKALGFQNQTAWIGTISGLALYSGQEWDIYNTANSGLSDNYIRCISTDNTGTKWIGTSNGLVAINGHPSERSWTTYNSGNSGLPLNNITAVAVDQNNKKWFGTWGGGVSSFLNGAWENFDMYNSPLPTNGIYDLKIDDSGVLWIATHNGGLVRYSGSEWQLFNINNSNIPSNLIYSIDFDNQGNIWLATEAGLVMYNDAGHWNLYNASNTGWNFTTVNCVKYDSLTGAVYFGTYNGLGIFSNGSFTFKKTSNSGISHNWISSVNIDSDGNIWIGTLGGGISVYNENGIHMSSDFAENILGKNLIQLSPNPVLNSALITVHPLLKSATEIAIYDLCGKLQKNFTIGTLQIDNGSALIDLSELPAGLYFYTVDDGKTRFTSKFVKA